MHFKKLVLPVLAITLLAAAFMVGQVYATTGCFNDSIGSPFETYICWMKDNGITSGTGPGTYSPDAYVTRGQMAAFMYRSSNVPPEIGDLYLSQSLDDLEGNLNYSGSLVEHYSNATFLKKATTGVGAYTINLNIPTGFYGKAIYIKSVEICYKASATASITGVYFDHYRHNVAFAIANLYDPTVRTDTNCQTFSLSSPSLLTSKDHVSVTLLSNITNTSNYVTISNITAILSPSASVASMEPALQEFPAPDGDPGQAPQIQP